jgi:hypothetical protein
MLADKSCGGAASGAVETLNCVKRRTGVAPWPDAPPILCTRGLQRKNVFAFNAQNTTLIWWNVLYFFSRAIAINFQTRPRELSLLRIKVVYKFNPYFNYMIILAPISVCSVLVIRMQNIYFVMGRNPFPDPKSKNKSQRQHNKLLSRDESVRASSACLHACSQPQRRACGSGADCFHLRQIRKQKWCSAAK